jgi:hypothetical protein
MNLRVYTLRFGKADWLDLCVPTLEKWCARHDYPLKVYGNDPQYPSPKFCEKDMLEDFLASDAEFLLYVDADVFVQPDAPEFPLTPGFHVAIDEPFPNWTVSWRKWCWEKMGLRVPDTFRHRNAGVWMADRASAELFLKHFQPPFITGTQEQNFFNAALFKATQDGMDLVDLDPAWNQWKPFRRNDVSPGHFIHLLGKNKLADYDVFVAAGLAPRRLEPFTLPATAPKLKRAVVYPWHADAAKWHELRLSLRSVEKFLEDDAPIFIYGTRRPSWLLFKPSRITFIDCWSYQDAVLQGTQVADEVMWMNDDICFLKPTRWEDVTPLHLGPITDEFVERFNTDPNPWRKGFVRAVTDLKFYGCEELFNYSTHTPYVYERQKVAEVLERFGIWPKIPLETLYHNFHASDGTCITDEKAVHPPFGDARFLNYRDEVLTPALKTTILELLPDFAPWELKAGFKP